MALINWLVDNKDAIEFKLGPEGKVLFNFIGEPKPIQDKETLKELLETDVFMVKYASNLLKNDLEIANICLNKSPFSLKHLSEKIRSDYSLVTKALELSKQSTNSYNLLGHAGDNIKSDSQFIFNLLDNNKSGKFFRLVSHLHKDNRELNLLAVKKGCPLKYIDKKYSEDKDFILFFVRQRADSLRFVAEHFRNDEEVVLESLKSNNAQSYSHAGEEAKKNLRIIAKTLKINKQMIYETPRAFQVQIKDEKDMAKFIESVLLKEDLSNSLTGNTFEPKKAKI